MNDNITPDSETQDIKLGAEAGSHHGPPDLFERDMKLLKDCMLWIQTVRQHGRKGSYGPEWLPSWPDMLKSRLFWRIRSGKAPLPEPPPCSYSCPWYEVVEDGVPHSVWPKDTVHFYEAGQEFFGKPLEKSFASINQERYELIEKREDGSYVVGFGGYRFHVFQGTTQTRYLRDNQIAEEAAPCWMIQRIAAEAA